MLSAFAFAATARGNRGELSTSSPSGQVRQILFVFFVDLAQDLNIAVVAEGAETEAEVDTLREIGCGDVQGYAIAHPMAANLWTEWLMLSGSGATVEHFQDQLARALAPVLQPNSLTDTSGSFALHRQPL
ncbi:EAL domain-containing protein [Oricola cellulosilytica]|uniref:EAL domain-containing protein n=1 Tax=Oricola cellulosilytica TaxID=1429082 RepID=UPI001CBBE8C9|nr:EAL domain-containing protein [Oricola cellulosilytica]